MTSSMQNVNNVDDIETAKLEKTVDDAVGAQVGGDRDYAGGESTKSG